MQASGGFSRFVEEPGRRLESGLEAEAGSWVTVPLAQPGLVTTTNVAKGQVTMATSCRPFFAQLIG
jgi:uncharacterized membrane protein